MISDRVAVAFILIGVITVVALALIGLIWVIDAISDKTRKM